MQINYQNALLVGAILLALLGVKAVAAQTNIKYAGALTFSPEGTLFVGDNVTGSIFAFETGAGQPPVANAKPLGINNIDARVADVLGVDKKNITINGMAVHPVSREVYLSVSRSFDGGFLPALVKVNSAGQIANVDLKTLKSSQYKIQNYPTNEQQFRSRAKDWAVPDANEYDAKAELPMRTLAIMDMIFYKGELFVSGISNQEFASTLRRIPFPFSGQETASNIQIYHISHARYETRAPILAMKIMPVDGEDTLVAAYTCSPLVLIPLKDLKDGAKVSGKTIGDMGNGQPLQMVPFQLYGQDMLFVTNAARGPMVISVKGLNGARSYTPENVPKGQLYDLSPEFPMGPVGKQIMFTGASLYADLLNKDFFVSVLRDARSGDLNLQALPTFLPITLNKIWSEFDFKGGEAKPQK